MRLAKVFAALLCPMVAAAPAQKQAYAEDQPTQSNAMYLPKVADIMGQTPLRHFKLCFARSLGSWELANFEVKQISDSLDTAAKLYPMLGRISFLQSC